MLGFVTVFQKGNAAVLFQIKIGVLIGQRVPIGKLADAGHGIFDSVGNFSAHT